MKRFVFVILIMLFSGVFFASCSKKENASLKRGVSSEEVNKFPELDQNTLIQTNFDPPPPPDYSFEEAPNEFKEISRTEADVINPPAD